MSRRQDYILTFVHVDRCEACDTPPKRWARNRHMTGHTPLQLLQVDPVSHSSGELVL